MRCYQFVDQQRSNYSVRLLCRVLDVVPARYYAWRKAATSARPAPAPAAWEAALEEVFAHHRNRYGTRCLRVELQEKGYRVGRQRLRTAMRARGLRALQPRAFTPRTTDSTHGLRCAPNRLLDQPAPTRSNQVWVSDIMYLPLASGAWAYLCASTGLLHPASGGLAGAPGNILYAGFHQLAPGLVGPRAGPRLVVHYDRGGQYCGNLYRALLAEHGCLRSQSRRAECLDNAQAKSL